MQRRRALLLSMPFSSLHYPSIGLSLLKPALEAEGLAVTLRYEFLRFADAIGARNQALLDDQAIYHSLVGEWIFAAEAHGGDTLDLGYLTEILQQRFGAQLSLERLHAILTARGRAAAFLDACLEAVEQDAPAIVGCTTSFQQNCASIALARRIKARRPETLIVFGGANCRGEMGDELLRRYDCIDAVCIDEGDRAFPAYVRRFFAGEDEPGATAGIIDRGSLAALPAAPEGEMIGDLDSLPYPDFEDFFVQHAASPAATAISKPTALFETSRGCWWGQKRHCTFCGINGNAMAYRSKSQDRAYEEVAFLAERFGPDLVNVDAILDYRYFDRFLPRLGDEGPPIVAYYELKSNITPEQMAALSRAGVKKIQPGIESLSTRVLKLMRKGCTMLQNVQTLKLAAESGVFVEWNLLHGFPGETIEDYQAIAALIPHLSHLQAPAVCGRVRADRFSPFWARPESFGVQISPNPAYAYIYPFAPESVVRLAYHFDMVGPDSPGLADAVVQATEAAACWQASQPESSLALWANPDGTVDTAEGRAGRAGWTRRFAGAAAFLLRTCWRAQPWAALAREYGDPLALQDAIDCLKALDLALVENGRVLTLALRQPGYASAPAWRAVRSGDVTPFALRGDVICTRPLVEGESPA